MFHSSEGNRRTNYQSRKPQKNKQNNLSLEYLHMLVIVKLNLISKKDF